MSLLEFRNSFLQSVLDLLWAQWCVLGVSGHSKNFTGECIDPEALILSTCHFGRFDQRIFDGMLEWLIKHENLINSNRLSALMKNDFKKSVRVIQATAAYLFSNENKIKWHKLAGTPPVHPEPESFFLFPNGSPVESYGYQDPLFLAYGFTRSGLEKKNLSGVLHLSNPAILWLRLRAFMGVSGRTEACVYLTTHPDGENPSTIARVMGYAQPGIHNALVNMSDSGWVLRREQRRDVDYILDESIRSALVSSLEGRPHWLTWSSFFSVIDVLWNSLNNSNLLESAEDVQSAEVGQAMFEVASELSRLGYSGYFKKSQNKRGAEYIKALSMAWDSIFDEFYVKKD